jgi:hypothetical protein
MLQPNLKTRASEAQSRSGRPRFAKTVSKTVVPLFCLGALLACGLPALADSHTYTYGSAHHTAQPSFKKLVSPTTHTGGYGKNGLPTSTPRSVGPGVKRAGSSQDRELDRMMREDVSLSGKTTRDRNTSATTYKPLSSQVSGQGSGINFTSHSNRSTKKH